VQFHPLSSCPDRPEFTARLVNDRLRFDQVRLIATRFISSDPCPNRVC
jgi:hypothetical protein